MLCQHCVNKKAMWLDRCYARYAVSLWVMHIPDHPVNSCSWEPQSKFFISKKIKLISRYENLYSFIWEYWRHLTAEKGFFIFMVESVEIDSVCVGLYETNMKEDKNIICTYNDSVINITSVHLRVAFGKYIYTLCPQKRSPFYFLNNSVKN